MYRIPMPEPEPDPLVLAWRNRRRRRPTPSTLATWAEQDRAARRGARLLSTR